MARHLVTAALPYANGPVHIGHLAGCYIPADIYVRYLRMKGEDVLFICGSDEHGVPITIKARQEGIAPQQVVDHYHEMMKKSFEDFGISFDHYSRTSARIHHETAAAFFKTLYDKNIFIEETTEQFYDEEAKQFLADRYITGTCPKCQFENAYGDQCENCGSSLNPTDLINPRSKLSGSTPVKKPTKNWYLPLDKFQQQLTRWIKEHAGDWKNNVYGQCMSWLNEGLKPRAMTRDLDWGVKVPLPDTEGKVLYVWFDAPIGYISATKEYRPDDWKKYWCDNDTKLVHFIGKDNIVFHCIIFPAMLMAHGGFVLPENVPANEFLNLEGDKISTSRNWAVWLHEYLKDFPGREDELRYVLTSIAPETKDSEFTWKDYQARVNNELVAILGNFVNRVIVLSNKLFNNDLSIHRDKPFLPINSAGNNAAHKYVELMEKFRFRDALSLIMDLARMGNKYLTDAEPWKKFNPKDPDSVFDNKCCLINCVDLITKLAVLAAPFLPKTSSRILDTFKVKEGNRRLITSNGVVSFSELVDSFNITIAMNSLLLFEKLEDGPIEKQITKLHQTKTMNNVSVSQPEPSTPLKPDVSFDDFQKLNIITATILEAERVPKTDKLLKLLLDTGTEKRTVVSGIAHCYEPEKIIGQRVLLLANLAPRKIKGIESKGMILMASDKEGKLHFATATGNPENGSPVT
jgi:methionyl-tRNA synthetase